MRDKRAKKVIFSVLLVVALGLILGLSGCSGSSSGGGSQPPQAASQVWGEANLAGFPLVGATITISDLSGTVLRTEENATGPFGAFIFDVDQLPADFNIQATGGTLDGEPFNGRVRALIRGFTSETWLSLNEVSTIVAAYSDAHPELSYEDVTDVVAIYLGVPYYVSLEEVIDTCDVYGGIFSPQLFSLAAKEEFGEFDLDSFVDIIVTEIDEGQERRFAAVDDYENFLPPGVELWEDEGVVSTQFAIGAVVKAVGGFLDFAGEIADAIFTMIYQNAVIESLTHIIGQLNTVQGQLVEIQTQLLRMQYLADQGQYDARMLTVNPYLTTIKNHTEELIQWMKVIPTDPEKVQQKTDRVTEIQNAILSVQAGQGYANVLENLSSAVATNDLTTSLMKLRSKVMRNNLEPGDSSTMDSVYIPFFSQLILRQLEGWVLYKSAYNNKFPGVSTARDAYKEWRNTKLKLQVDSFVQGAEDYAMNHLNGDFYNQAFPCNDAYGTFLGNVDVFAETLYPTFPEYDANGLVNGAKDGVLFVRLAFPVFPPPSDGNYLDPRNNKYLLKLHQNQNPFWMDNPSQLFADKVNNLNAYLLNTFKGHYTIRTIEGKIAFSTNTPKVAFYEDVTWKLGTFRIPVSSLGDGWAFTFDKLSPCLKKCVPHLYRGGDNQVELRVSRELKVKYGWWHLQMAPSLETRLSTGNVDCWMYGTTPYFDGCPEQHIWVDWGEYDSYQIYRFRSKDSTDQKTDKLMLKYVGNGYFTISPNSSLSSPYHVFCVDNQRPYPPNWARKGFEVRARTDAFGLWEINAESFINEDNVNKKVIGFHATGYYAKWSKGDPWYRDTWFMAHRNDVPLVFYRFLGNATEAVQVGFHPLTKWEFD